MSRPYKDYTGQICGCWKVIERDFNPSSKSHETFWKSECQNCGSIASVRKGDLDKNPKSCNKCKGKIIQQKALERGCSIYIVNKGDIFGYLEVISEPFYPTSSPANRYVKCLCHNCNNIKDIRVDHLFGAYHSKTISCGCSKISSGELKIKQILDNLNIKYQQQYKIANFSNFSLFDFAIFDNNNELFCLIEYDGEQHFYPVDYFGGESQFKIQQERDKRKNEYCKENHILLIRIPYTDYDKIDSNYILSFLQFKK